MKKRIMFSILFLTLILSTNLSFAKKDDSFKKISTSEVKNAIGNKDYQILDTRLTDEYNGWDLEKNGTGGHIESSTDFSFNWIGKITDKELKTLMDNKGITKESNLILYNTNQKNSLKVANYLKKNGFKNISLYDLKNWTKDGEKLESFPNYDMIVPAKIVKDIIDKKDVENISSKKTKIIEVSWGPAAGSYNKGHVPTSFHIDTNAVEPPPKWMLKSDKNLEKFANKYGFSKNDSVILTGKDQMAAYRLAVVLRYIGLDDVRVLNGGNKAWTDAGYKLVKEGKKYTSNKKNVDFSFDKNLIMSIEELQKELKDDNNFQLIDNRTWDEYIGKSSGYTYHKKKGRIPGAIYGYAGSGDSTTLDYYRNPDNTMRNGYEIKSMLEKQGINFNNKLATMCGSGWRAAETLTYLNVLGYKDISLYSDGWIGWSNANLPSESGDPSKL